VAALAKETGKMGKYEELNEAVASNPIETEASDRIGSNLESFSDEMESETGFGEATGEQSVDEMLSEAMANEESEEAKVQGSDGHEPLSSGAQTQPDDELDELSDGEAGAATPATGTGEAPSETYLESSAAEDLFEVEGFDPETTEFADEQFERIHGRDDRVRVYGTRTFPWRTICKLEITAANGRRFGCTGSMIGPRVVLTNGHCVFLHNNGGWARSIRVIPGKNGSSEPFDSATSRHFHSVRGWTRDRSSNYDYGVIILPSNNKLGNRTGWMGLARLSFFSLLGLRINSSGYPGDKPYGTQWWNSNNILAVTARRVYYRIDTYFGQSGSPNWRYKNGKRHIVAVHNTGGSVMNGGVRLSKPVFNNLVNWKNTHR
jgi:V8-like Glu-specific endopeptidase